MGDRQVQTAEPLPDWQLKTFEAYLPYVLGVTGPEHEQQVAQATRRFDAYVRALPIHEKRARDKLYSLLLWTTIHGTFVGHGTRPWNQTATERQRFIERFFESDEKPADKFWDVVGKLVPHSIERATIRDLAKSLREVMGLAFYSNPASDTITGYERIWKREKLLRERTDVDTLRLPPPRPFIFDPEEVARVHFQGHPYQVDRLFREDGRPKVAVIGSGAGGAVVAARLAQSGNYDVAIFEAGPRFRPGDYPLDTLVGMSQLFEDGLMTLSRNLDLHLLRGRLVGGGTVMTSGLSVRPRKRTLEAWTSGLNADTYLGLASADMDIALEAIRKRQSLGTINPALFTDPSHLLEKGAKALGGGYRFDTEEALNNVMMQPGQRPHPTPDQNGDYCLGCGLCNYGCHFGHKLSMDLTYIPDAEKAGARVHPNLPVERLVGEYLGDGEMRVTALEIGRGSGMRVPVDHVVLACGAVGSPALLLRSAQADPAWDLLPAFQKGWVGTHLGFNYGSGVAALYSDAFEKPGHRGFQIKYIATKDPDEDFTLTGHHGPHVTRYVMENAFVPPGLLSNVVPGVGEIHKRWMQSYDRLAMCATTIGSPLHGTIDPDRDVHYRLSESEHDLNVRALASIVRLYLASGADEVGLSGVRQGRKRAGLGVGLRLRKEEFGQASEKAIYDELRVIITEPEHLMLSSAHPQGGLRMSHHPDKGAVDSGFRLRGAQNVFVSDASLFPTTIVVNPQWTIAALGWLAGAAIDATLSKKTMAAK